MFFISKLCVIWMKIFISYIVCVWYEYVYSEYYRWFLPCFPFLRNHNLFSCVLLKYIHMTKKENPEHCEIAENLCSDFDHWYVKFKNSASAVFLPLHKDESLFLFHLSFSVTSSRGQLCVCTVWVMWEGCFLVHMPTGTAPTISGYLIKEESPTHDQEL